MIAAFDTSPARSLLLTLEPLADQAPGPGEILERERAAAVTPLDTY